MTHWTKSVLPSATVADRAGHRESALGLVNQALAQTDADVAAGAR